MNWVEENGGNGDQPCSEKRSIVNKTSMVDHIRTPRRGYERRRINELEVVTTLVGT